MSTEETAAGAGSGAEPGAFGYRQELRRSLTLRDLLVYGPGLVRLAVGVVVPVVLRTTGRRAELPVE